MDNWWISSCIFLAMGVVFALASLLAKGYAGRNERHLKQAEARVVDILTETRTGNQVKSEFNGRQTAVFEFFADGKLFKVPDQTEAYPCPYYMNQKVKILYDPHNPEEFFVVKQNRLKRIIFGMNYMSVMCVLLGCILFLMHASRIEV